VGLFAKSCGVNVSILGFEGANCNLQMLSAVAEHTGGAVDRVNPDNISANFGEILE
jgi:phosphoribosylformylglycinamidine (FGAM) synthase-like amidotransferase family enzyme